MKKDNIIADRSRDRQVAYQSTYKDRNNNDYRSFRYKSYGHSNEVSKYSIQKRGDTRYHCDKLERENLTEKEPLYMRSQSSAY